MYRDWACNIQIALVQPLIITNSFRHMPTDGCQSDQFLFRKCHDDRLRVDPSQFVAQWWEKKNQAAQVMTCWFSSTKARANGFCFRMSLGKASVKQTKIRPRRFKVSEVSSARMFNQRPVFPASVRTNKYGLHLLHSTWLEQIHHFVGTTGTSGKVQDGTVQVQKPSMTLWLWHLANYLSCL